MSKLFFVPKESITANKIIIKDKDAHHIKDVLRFKERDSIVVCDGSGKEYLGEIESILPRRVVVNILETRQAPAYRLPPVTLCVAIPKKQKMDHIVEKCTELGIDTIIPMVTQRTIPSKSDKSERWQRIAKEASQQCGRAKVTEIKNITAFKDILGRVGDFQLALFFHLIKDRITLDEAIKNWKGGPVLVFIGPEGDFTQEEIELAKGAGCVCVDLGPLVLKVDTASIAVMSILDYEFRQR